MDSPFEYKEISYTDMGELNRLGSVGWLLVKSISSRYGKDDEGENEELYYYTALFVRSIKGGGGYQ